MKKLGLRSLISLGFFTSIGLGYSCNLSPQEASQILKRILHIPTKVFSVNDTPINGLCEVVWETPNGLKFAFYISEDGRYLIVGMPSGFTAILDLKTGKNLTRLHLMKYYQNFNNLNLQNISNQQKQKKDISNQQEKKNTKKIQNETETYKGKLIITDEDIEKSKNSCGVK